MGKFFVGVLFTTVVCSSFVHSTETKKSINNKEVIAEINIGNKDLQNEIETRRTLLAEKDEQIAFYKDLKTRMSTKMVGETLEQHCLYEFNRIRI